MADEVPVADHDGGWKEMTAALPEQEPGARSERGAAGAARGRRGERAERKLLFITCFTLPTLHHDLEIASRKKVKVHFICFP